MSIKYYRYTLQGALSADEAQSALGDNASQGLVVRVDTLDEETHVYVAQQVSGTAVLSARKGINVNEVSEDEVMKLG